MYDVDNYSSPGYLIEHTEVCFFILMTRSGIQKIYLMRLFAIDFT